MRKHLQNRRIRNRVPLFYVMYGVCTHAPPCPAVLPPSHAHNQPHAACSGWWLATDRPPFWWLGPACRPCTAAEDNVEGHGLGGYNGQCQSDLGLGRIDCLMFLKLNSESCMKILSCVSPFQPCLRLWPDPPPPKGRHATHPPATHMPPSHQNTRLGPKST